MTRKSTALDGLWLWVNPFRQLSPAARCDNPKKCGSRRPSAFGRYSTKSSSSLRLWIYTEQKASPAFGNVLRKNVETRQPSALGRYPAKSPTSPSELCSEKTFRPGCLQLWGDPLRKATPAFGNVPRKNIPARQLSAFGQFSAKSLASVRKCTPKRRSGQTTSGCLSTPIARLPKRPAAMTRKSTVPDSLWLLVNPLQKIPPAFGDVPQPFASGYRL